MMGLGGRVDDVMCIYEPCKMLQMRRNEGIRRTNPTCWKFLLNQIFFSQELIQHVPNE